MHLPNTFMTQQSSSNAFRIGLNLNTNSLEPAQTEGLFNLVEVPSTSHSFTSLHQYFFRYDFGHVRQRQTPDLAVVSVTRPCDSICVSRVTSL